jgi:dTDP-4-dehydrorhamnose reductase
MSKPKVTVLGATGMLGAVTLDSFYKSGDFELTATYRDENLGQMLKKQYPGVNFRVLDAETASQAEVAEAIKGSEWVVNAIGVIKPYIHDDNPEETERAIRVNALFPHLLAKASKAGGARVLQIATDCTYSGKQGKYKESDQHDAIDVYGKTKSLGEAYADTVHHLRCSIIGPEPKAHVSLLDWFLGQDKNAEVNGFTNHQWNGVTTLHFAKVCQGIITHKIELPHLQHVIPGNIVSKSDLLKSFADAFKRTDIKVNEVEAPTVIDRTLQTENEDKNKEIWKAAGYEEPPTIEQMVDELAAYNYSGSEAA